jgi:hypothetical protein
MFNVRNNFRNNYREDNIQCPLCEKAQDTQQHLFTCETLQSLLPSPVTSNHDDIFSSDIDTLTIVAKELKILVEIRENLIEEKNERKNSA